MAAGGGGDSRVVQVEGDDERNDVAYLVTTADTR